jgi:hypothetical protein
MFNRSRRSPTDLTIERANDRHLVRFRDSDGKRRHEETFETGRRAKSFPRAVLRLPAGERPRE